MNASYVPGDRVAAVTGRVVVMAGEDRAAELSALADGESTPLGVIAALSGGDLTRLPEFAAAVLDGADVVVLVRGSYTVRAGGQEWSGGDVATWREHRVPADGQVVIDHDEGADGRELPLVAGVVLAARVTWRPETSAVTTPETSSARVERDPLATQDPDVTVLVVEDVTEVEPEDDAKTETGDATDVQADDGGEAADGFDETVGATIQGQRVNAPAPAPVEGDHDGRTITAEQMRALRARKDPGAPAATTQVSATLAVSGGETVDLAKPVLIGRSPRAAHKTGAQLPRMLVVDDPYVSGTHLEVAVQEGSVVATDRSTNGTMLARPGGQPERLPKDEPTAVGDGCVLRLSDDLTVTISVHGTVG